MGISRRVPSPVELVVVALGVTSIILAWTKLRGLDALTDVVSIPLPLLVVAFAIGEIFVIFLHFRSESGAISFREVPLILGALFAPPLTVWLATTMGAVYAFAIVKKQAPIKSTFNTANLSMQAAITLLILHRFASDPLGPQGWLVASFAAVLAGMVSIVAFIIVVSIVEGRLDFQGIRHTVFASTLTTVSNVGIAFIAAGLIDYRPAMLLLLIAPIGILYAAYRSFVSEREQREKVQFMYESTAEISAMRQQSAIPTMLASTAERLRAAHGDLFLLPVEGSDKAATWYSATMTDDRRPLESLNAMTASAICDVVATPQIASPELLLQLHALTGQEFKSAIIGVLRVDDRVLGFLSISDRLGAVASFTDSDVTLFSTVVDQLTLALENNQLGQTVTELKRVERELSEQAHHDALTGLANRTKLANVLNSALTQEQPVSVLYIDLDDFKLINDGLGHQAGDVVLVETATRIREVIGDDDCVARLGGDEFAVVLLNPADDMNTAKRILAAINHPMSLTGHEARVGASIGVARARPGQDLDSVIAAADLAMYTAKGNGKGSVALDRPAARTSIRPATLAEAAPELVAGEDPSTDELFTTIEF